MIFAIANRKAVIVKVIVSLLLVIGILLAIFALYGCLMLLFVWYVEYIENADYYPNIRH
jgi:uncharacterized membrane protein YphA (DoxX/SURF4 family)